MYMKIDKLGEYDEALTLSDFYDIREVELNADAIPELDNQEERHDINRLLPKFPGNTEEEVLFRSLVNCRDVDKSVFFPGKTDSNKLAKSICAECIVREDCLNMAISNKEEFGIWGGMTARERRNYRRRIRTQQNQHKSQP